MTDYTQHPELSGHVAESNPSPGFSQERAIDKSQAITSQMNILAELFKCRPDSDPQSVAPRGAETLGPALYSTQTSESSSQELGR